MFGKRLAKTFLTLFAMYTFVCVADTSKRPLAELNFNNQNNNSQNNSTRTVVIPEAPTSTWPMLVKDRKSYIAPSADVLRKRLRAMEVRPQYADPITLKFNMRAPVQIMKQLGNKYFVPTNPVAVDYFKKMILPRIQSNGRMVLSAHDLKWMDLEKLSKTLRRSMPLPFITRDAWNEAFTSIQSNEHLGPRSKEIKSQVNRYLKEHPKNGEIPLQYFLPTHARSGIGDYFSLRGRNCFATALSFWDKNVVGRSFINPVREPEHDKNMINHDEFSHALWLGFYELREVEIANGLKLGDVVVFFDGAQGASYQALKHAAIHLAGNYYYHKQSKSAASPIEFTTWQELAEPWYRMSPTTDYKVFRKLPIGMDRYQNQESAIEKIFWTN